MSEWSQQIEQRLLTTDRYAQDDEIRQLHTIELGIIEEIDSSTHRCTVRTFYTQGGQTVHHYNVELLTVGTIGGGMDIIGSGTLCILFRTANPVLDSQTGEVCKYSRPYSSNGIKAFPVCNVTDADIHMGFDEDGSFQVRTDSGLSIIIQDDTIVIGNDGKTLVQIDDEQGFRFSAADGHLIQWYGSSGIEYIAYNDQWNPVYKCNITLSNITTSLYKSDSQEWIVCCDLDAVNKKALVTTAEKIKAEITTSGITLQTADKIKVNMTDSGITLQTSDNVKVNMTDSGITLQTSSSKKIEMTSSSVKINGHLEVT